MSEYEVRVGYCLGYPIMPDLRYTWIKVAAETDAEARLVACQMVAARGMHPTSATIEELVL